MSSQLHIFRELFKTMISIKSFNGFVSVDLTVLQKMKRHYLLPTILIYFGIGNLNAIVKSGAASPHSFCYGTPMLMRSSSYFMAIILSGSVELNILPFTAE